MVRYLGVRYRVKIAYRGKETEADAYLTKKVWFNAISKRLFAETFGESWSKLVKPHTFIVKGVEVYVKEYVVLNVVLGKKQFDAEFFVSDELMRVAEKETDLIIGKKSLDENKILIFED